jgi:septum formation protein
MRSLRDDEIGDYVQDAPDWVLGTVGGYGLESTGARLFERVEGDYFTILGLPLFMLLPILRREGVLPW